MEMKETLKSLITIDIFENSEDFAFDGAKSLDEIVDSWTELDVQVQSRIFEICQRYVLRVVDCLNQLDDRFTYALKY